MTGIIKGARRFEDQGLRTLESFTITVDPVSGQVIPSGSIPPICSQAEADKIGAFKYLQHAVDATPLYINHNVIIQLLAGEHRAPDDNFGDTYNAFWIPKDYLSETQRYNFLTDPAYREYGVPSIYIKGTLSDEETGVAGTITAQPTNTFTRTTGTWTPSEHKNRFVEITSGVGAGSRYYIIDNDATTLYFSDTVYSGGSAVLRIYSLASILDPRLSDGTLLTQYGIERYEGNVKSKYSLVDLSIGSPTYRMPFRFSNMIFEIWDCLQYCYYTVLKNGELFVVDGHMETSSTDPYYSGFTMLTWSYLRTSNFHVTVPDNVSYVISLRDHSKMYGTGFQIDTSGGTFAGAIIQTYQGFNDIDLDTACSVTGNGDGKLFEVIDAELNVQLDTKLTVSGSFDTLLSANNSKVKIDTNNLTTGTFDKGFVCDNGAKVSAGVPGVSFTTSDAVVDGTSSSGELSAAGDSICGPEGSEVLYW